MAVIGSVHVNVAGPLIVAVHVNGNAAVGVIEEVSLTVGFTCTCTATIRGPATSTIRGTATIKGRIGPL